MKKWMAVLMALTLSLGALACGAQESKTAETTKAPAGEATNAATEAEQTTEAAAEGKVGGKLVIWEHTAQFEAPLNAVIEGFSALYPDVQVEYQVKTSDQYYNLLQTAMQAGEAPDVFWTNGKATPNYKTYADQGLLMELNGKVDFSLFDGTQAMGIVDLDGKYYASPTAELGGRAVYYNKDIFKQLNLEVPKNFEEFEKALETIHAADILPISFAASGSWTILFQFEPVLAATGLDWLMDYETTGTAKLNAPQVVAAYEKMLEWADKGYYGPGYTGVDGSGAILAFSKGEAAMCIDGTWNIQVIQKNNPELNFGAFQIPTPDGKYPFVSTSSCGFSISKETQNPDAALAFVNYFASLEGQTAWVSTLNAIPCTPQIVAADPVIADVSRYDLIAPSYYDILGKMAKPGGESPNKVWEEDQPKVFSGGLTPQEFTDSLQELCE